MYNTDEYSLLFKSISMTIISQQRIQEIQTTTLTTTKNDTTTWQLHNAMIYTGSYSASNMMLNYETWPNLKAVYRLIVIMNIQWFDS